MTSLLRRAPAHFHGANAPWKRRMARPHWLRERRRHKAPSQSFPQGGLADEGGPDTTGPRWCAAGTGGVKDGPDRGASAGLGCPRARGQGGAAGPGPPQPSEGLVPLVEISRRPAAALCSAVLHVAATLDLGSRRGAITFRALMYSFPSRPARPIVTANANGTQIGMTPSSRASSPGPVRLGRPCPDVYVQGRRVVTPVEKRPWERQRPGSSATFRSSDPGRRTPD